MQPRACYNEYPTKGAFTGTKVHGDEQFRIRPQTPKINMIELREKQSQILKRNNLQKIERPPSKLESIEKVEVVKVV